MPPLPCFTHSFRVSGAPEPEAVREADVIFADLRALPAAELPALFGGGETEVILLAEPGQFALLAPCAEKLEDLWPLPLSEEGLRFRFLRWQRRCKERRDAWETKQYLEATINSIPNLVWYKTKDGIHEKVNDSFCRTVNKTKEQVQGRGHAYIWDVEADDPACIESERVVMESRKTHVSQETIMTGGGQRLLTTYKSPLYDWDGSVMGTVGVAIDITQEEAYRQELLQKNSMLEAIFTSLDCGVICHTTDGSRIISINKAALDILGYASQEELTRDGFFMVAPSVLEEDKPLLRNAIMSLTEVGDSTSVEYRVSHAGGRVLHVVGSLKLMEEDGRLYFRRLLLDCTEQKLREQQERKAAEQRHSSLIQALSVDFNLVCYFDLNTGEDSLLRLQNCQYGILEEYFSKGQSQKKGLSRYINHCVLSEDRPLLRAALSPKHLVEELSQRPILHFGYRTQCGGGTSFFQMKVVRTGDWEKGERGVVLGFRNVDEDTRREMEERTLLEDALSQANRASKAKSTFLSNMSHDIRTPMNAIVGFITLALSHIDQREVVEEYLKKSLTSSNHLVSLINDVLDMSRIESGKMHLEESLCSLPEILHGLKNIVQADIHAKQLDFYVDAVDVFHEEVYCDRLRLNQVLLNLLSNAIKYTNPGGIVSMRIRETGGAPEGCARYEFTVKDTGIGMKPDFVSHIFEPFERERNSTISGIQGTGLGMAITKNIVDMMNGAIEVRSEQGAGSEFLVTVTFRVRSGPKEPLTIPKLQGARALVVDDDFNTCDSVSYMLQELGLRAEWTLSGREAVLRTHQAAVRGDTYSVYVLDWRMPDMNGLEVAREIRREMGDQVPIIVLTAYDWSDIKEEAEEAGVTAFCSKPLFLSDLRRCLYSVTEGHEAEEDRPSREAHSFRMGRILLAEDNELNQEIATAILTEAGFTVDVAANGQLAVETLESSDPDRYQLVLMDIQMPVMDGYTAAQAIRALPDRRLASVPILAMTANAFEEDRQRALQCGMNGHISKPIDINKMFETLDGILHSESKGAKIERVSKRGK